ncbi:MAG: DUF6291 domain-containing protein [Clostridiales bacterium]|nr:DUF6291 domain-containing protein [Clostridiales bacterium]
MEKRDAFMFFRSFYEAASKIPDETDRAKYYEAIFRYALDGELPELTGVPAAMFTLTKPNLDKSWKRAEAGSKGGQSIKANSKQTVSKTEANSKNPEAIKDKGQGIKDKEFQDKGNKPPKSPAVGIQEQRFDQFWQLYPKKVGKKAAFNAWEKIKPDADLFNRIIQAVTAAKASDDWKKDGGRFIPNPLTWLNQGRWDDEPFTPVQPETPTVTTPRRDPMENPWKRNGA